MVDKVQLKKNILIIFLIIISFFAWSINLIRPGGDSYLYYVYSEYIYNYLSTGHFNEMILDNAHLSFHIDKKFILTPFEHFKFDETMSYIYLSAYSDFILHINNGIIFIQIFLAFITFNNIFEIVKYYYPYYQFSYSFLEILIGMPIFLISLFPAKESITLFFITILFKLFLYKRIFSFIFFLILFYIYRWNNCLLFIGFIIMYYFSIKLLLSKYVNLYNILLFFVIAISLFIGVKSITYVGTGYNSFEIKMLLTSFSFPLIKIPINDMFSMNHIFISLWKDLYSIVWYFFLIAFFFALFNKNNIYIKALSSSLLVIILFLGCISSGDQLSRFKFAFYSIYVVIGLLQLSYLDIKIYIKYFIVLLFINYFQLLNYIIKNLEISLYGIINVLKNII